MYSPAFYAACTAGGIASCGLTHMAVTPLDLVKCNMQIDPAKYKSITSGFGILVKEQGVRGFFRGWVPTLLGYSAQGACNFAGGYIAGVFCAVVSHPADNLVSFLNNAKGATVGDAVKKLGVWGLFTRGLPLRIVMIGTLTGAQWGIYDAFKVMVGLPTTGGVTPAPASASDATLKAASA
ncbi:hypothetical protein E2562_018109 [Oryza meyeriana var. granulata]|uniref:Mitochondrial carrier protein n=1 Tax=Oryza meyeriana var. granulata TaxID=110450 RepID=A0A6G1CR80_9ORYZ|nr:hypothetical protein E2562_018109 [Oryza meyeriana var. granulata]